MEKILVYVLTWDDKPVGVYKFRDTAEKDQQIVVRYGGKPGVVELPLYNEPLTLPPDSRLQTYT